MSIIYKKNHLAFLLAIAMFLLVIFGPKFALAAPSKVALNPDGLDQSPVTRGLCNVFEMANGNIGKAIAIFAIVAVGFGFFTGKFSIALVIGITLGIGILFGAPKIIAALTGNQAVDCSTITSGDTAKCPVPVGGNLAIAGATANQNTKDNSLTLVSSDGQDVLFIGCRTDGSATKLFVESKVPSVGARSTSLSTVLGSATSTGASFTTNWGQLSFPALNAKLDIADVTSASGISFTSTGGYVCPAIPSVISATWSTTTCPVNQRIATAFTTVANYACIASNANFAIDVALAGTSAAVSTHAHAAGGTVSLSVSQPGLPGDVRKIDLPTSGSLNLTCGTGSVWTLSKSGNNVLAAGAPLAF